jgi:transcriptional regulator with XRE-family HTH domain
MSSDIGARLKAIREQQGFSQRELAKRTGVTHATVSLIEQNKVSPSVSSLKKILGGLSLSVGDFFAPDRSPEQKIFFTKDELLEIGGGKISLRQVGEDLHGRSNCCTSCIIPAPIRVSRPTRTMARRGP